MFDKRAAGVLLPVTSLPSRFGIGDLGRNAYHFIDFLYNAGQSLWQVLPLHPTSSVLGNSPYSSSSAFAGNPLLISPEGLVELGWFAESDLDDIPDFPETEVIYERVYEYKYSLLDRAYQRFREHTEREEFHAFCHEHSFWLDDYACYLAIKKVYQGQAWYDWPEALRDRQTNALDSVRRDQAEEIERQKFYQFVFYSQWSQVKDYANSRSVVLVGDTPIYVHGDSADTWSNQTIFKLGDDGRPTLVSGVPPDYFSKTGQLWGNPVYDWATLEKTGFKWWLTRLAHMLNLYNTIRIDHFRGLIACWEVPAGEKTAVNGQWTPVPHRELFQAIRERFNEAPIIAEDLGTITEDVREALREYGYPGMKILQFAFGNDDSEHPYLPHNYPVNCIVYTGTHDNNTVRGWFDSEARPEDRRRMVRYLGHDVEAGRVHWELARLAFASVARWAILPMQDVLGLGRESRINRPATATGNWKWRLTSHQLQPQTASDLKELTKIYGRLSQE